MAGQRRPWRSGHCNPGNPPEIHAQCEKHPRADGVPCCCPHHDDPPVHDGEEPHVWAGQSVEKIRDRWATGDPYADDCGEHRVRPDRHHAVLEGLRHARVDVLYLLRVIDQRDAS